MKTSIALLEAHLLMAQGLSDWIRKDFEEYELLFVAESSEDLFNHLDQNLIPEILVLDDYKHDVGGLEIIKILNAQFPTIKVLVYTFVDEGEQIEKIIRAGAGGYLPKGCNQSEFKQALDNIRTKGYHYPEPLSNS